MTCKDTCCRGDEEDENPDPTDEQLQPSESWLRAKAQMESDERLYRWQRDRERRANR